MTTLSVTFLSRFRVGLQHGVPAILVLVNVRTAEMDLSKWLNW
jgi:hypothetical protein